jgi:radical SAM-linked protein
MVRHKVRIRFRKGGDLRWISHHDLMRCFERMLRRAGLPFRSTEGFNPRPRLVFALSLPLGIVGCDEIAELELTEDVAPAAVRERLAPLRPAGLEILSVEPAVARGAAQVSLVTYRVPLPPERQPGLPERAGALLAAPEHWIERTRPHRRRLDLRAYLADLRVSNDAVEMDLHVTPKGTARPDEVLEALGLADLLQNGAVLERTRLELCEAVTTPLSPPASGAGLAEPPDEPEAVGTTPALPARWAADAGGGTTPPADVAPCPPGGNDLREGNT